LGSLGLPFSLDS